MKVMVDSQLAVELNPGSKVHTPVSGKRRRTSRKVAPAASRSTGISTVRPSAWQGNGNQNLNTSAAGEISVNI
jgi:hypothetical protein